MNKHFPDIVDTSSTAGMERKHDDVEEGRQSWTQLLHSFYGEVKVSVEKAEAEMDRVQKPVEEIGELCPECGRNLVIRTGRFGRFISCSGFPDCRYRRSFMNKTGALCPQCNGDLVERKTKQKKRVFFGCSNYPTCNFAIWERPVPELCPNCGGLMVVPRVGQDPVCYQEVIAVQRSDQAQPQQEEKTAQRATRKSSSAAADGASEATTTAPKRTTKTTSRVKTAGKTSTRATKTKKPAARASTTNPTTTSSKSNASRARRSV